MKVVNTGERKMVFVRNIKNVSFKERPEYEFFVHRSLLTEGFSVTEKLSGACLIWGESSVKAAIVAAEKQLLSRTKRQLSKAVKAAIKIRKEIEQTENGGEKK